MLRSCTDGQVCEKGYLLDQFVMISDEAEMTGCGARVFPAREGYDFQNQTGKTTGLFNKWVDEMSDIIEILLSERPRGTDMQD